MNRDFFVKYHAAVTKASEDHLEKLKSQVGSEFANEFKDKAGGKIEDVQEFCRALEEYLEKDLGFAERAAVTCSEDKLTIEVRGCDICHGNEALRQEKKPTLCPIIPAGLFSISRVGGRKATLKGVTKNGVVGECDINYELT